MSESGRGGAPVALLRGDGTTGGLRHLQLAWRSVERVETSGREDSKGEEGEEDAHGEAGKTASDSE